MNRPQCACVHPDAGQCLRWRTAQAGLPDDEEFESWPDAECECDCHQQDEDGYTEWDDRTKPPPEW